MGVLLTQLDDDGQKFMVAYDNWSNNKTKVKYSSYEGECLVVVWVIHHFDVVFIVIHSLRLLIIIEIPYGIKLTRRKVSWVDTYHIRV